MYALNDELGLDVNLMTWNITLDNPNLENILEGVRADLTKAEAEKRESKELFGQRLNIKGDSSYVY